MFLKLENGFRSRMKNGQVRDRGTKPATRSLCGQVQVFKLYRDQEKNLLEWQLRHAPSLLPFYSVQFLSWPGPSVLWVTVSVWVHEVVATFRFSAGAQWTVTREGCPFLPCCPDAVRFLCLRVGRRWGEEAPGMGVQLWGQGYIAKRHLWVVGLGVDQY